MIVHSLFNITVTQVCNWDLKPLADGEDSKCRPNHYVK